MKDFLNAVKERRSCYMIQSDATISDERIEELVKEAALYCPSAFNMQSTRLMLLLNSEHTKFWELTAEILRQKVPEDKFEAVSQKINSFAAGHGTILYFDETSVTSSYGDRFAQYKENFPVWAQQANGMLQFILWTLLEAEGMGASLQHYNPLIDEEVKRTWNVPESWELIAQMPFGKLVEAPAEKQLSDVMELVRVSS